MRWRPRDGAAVGQQWTDRSRLAWSHLTGWLYLNDERTMDEMCTHFGQQWWTPRRANRRRGKAARRLVAARSTERRRLNPLDWQLRSRHSGHDASGLTCPQTSNHSQHEAADVSTATSAGHNALALLEADAIRCSTERRNHCNRRTPGWGRAGPKQAGKRREENRNNKTEGGGLRPCTCACPMMALPMADSLCLGQLRSAMLGDARRCSA